MKILNAFWMAFWWLLGPTWPQNPPKSRPQGRVLFLLCWVLERTWGALGASWGPRANFIDFWSIFDRFLIDFWWIFIDFLVHFEWFLNDFWSIVLWISDRESCHCNWMEQAYRMYFESWCFVNCAPHAGNFGLLAQQPYQPLQQQLQNQKIHYI